MLAMAKADFYAVRKIARSFPGVEESLYYGHPALKIDGRMFACIASHCSAEPASLVVRVDFPRRDELLAEAPDIFYVTPHYVGYPAVLARLPKVQPEVLRGLLAGALQLVSRDSRKKPRVNRRSALGK
jgi:hypothetical protein